VNINLEPIYKDTWKDIYPVFLSPNLDTRITGNKRFRDEVDNYTDNMYLRCKLCQEIIQSGIE
jgi:hypothetical protein